MFGKQRVAQAMNRRLPTFERPACAQEGCTGKLEEPRPFHTEAQGAPGVLTVHCLGKCATCGAHHKGERKVAVGKTTRALEQAFHLYTEEDAALVRSLLPKYQGNTQKLTEIQNMPVRD